MAEKVVRFEETMNSPSFGDDIYSLDWVGAYILDEKTGTLEGYIEDKPKGLIRDGIRRAWIIGLTKGDRWCFCWFASRDFDFPIMIRFFDRDEENGIIASIASSNGKDFDLVYEVAYSKITRETLPKENTEAKEVIRSIVDDITRNFDKEIIENAKKALLNWARFYYETKTGRPW